MTDLFQYAASLEPQWHEYGHDTEVEAALRARVGASRMLRRVLRMAIDRGSKGIIYKEVVRSLGRSAQQRLSDLCVHRILVQSGKKREGCNVWVLPCFKEKP